MKKRRQKQRDCAVDTFDNEQPRFGFLTVFITSVENVVQLQAGNNHAMFITMEIISSKQISGISTLNMSNGLLNQDAQSQSGNLWFYIT